MIPQLYLGQNGCVVIFVATGKRAIEKKYRSRKLTSGIKILGLAS
jgi:hypothetical protein